MDVDWINRLLGAAYNESYAVLENGIPDKVGEWYLFSRYIIINLDLGR